MNKKNHMTTLSKRDLKKCSYSMNMNDNNHITTLPITDLKTSSYRMNMNNNNYITTLPIKGLKTSSYRMNMDDSSHITTLPKRDLKTSSYRMNMNKKNLKKLSKSQLIELLLKRDQKQMVDECEGLIIPPPEQFRDAYKPILPPRTGKWESVKPKPVPRKNVKQMVKEYEALIIPPPEQFRDGYKPIPKPRTDRPLQMRGNQNARRLPNPQRSPPPPTKREPSSKIKELSRALKEHAKSYEVEIQDNLNPLNHFTKTKALIESHLKDLLKTMKGYKFIETLEVTFVKMTINSKTGEREDIYKQHFSIVKLKPLLKLAK